MTTIGSVVTLPVLRPLVGMDKDEITAEAQRLGTYPISIIPTRTAARSSRRGIRRRKAKPHEVERAEANLPIDEIVAQAPRTAH